MEEKVKSQPPPFEERFCLFRQENGLGHVNVPTAGEGGGQFYPDVSLQTRG